MSSLKFLKLTKEMACAFLYNLGTVELINSNIALKEGQD